MHTSGSHLQRLRQVYTGLKLFLIDFSYSTQPLWPYPLRCNTHAYSQRTSTRLSGLLRAWLGDPSPTGTLAQFRGVTTHGNTAAALQGKARFYFFLYGG